MLDDILPSQGEASWSSIFMGGMFIAERSEIIEELREAIGNEAPSACCAWPALTSMGRGSDIVTIGYQQQKLVLTDSKLN